MMDSQFITTTSVITNKMIVNLINNCKADSIVNHDSYDGINIIREQETMGTSVAVNLCDKTLAIGGVGRFHPGVGTAWIIIDKLFINYPKKLLQVCREIIQESFEFLNLHRVQMDIDLQYKENIRFSRALGFHEEGVMKWFGPNKEDYARYVRFKEM